MVGGIIDKFTYCIYLSKNCTENVVIYNLFSELREISDKMPERSVKGCSYPSIFCYSDEETEWMLIKFANKKYIGWIIDSLENYSKLS